ncbi:MAG: ABC transporter ATP-binding protein [Flavobacteriaceae bacterium]
MIEIRQATKIYGEETVLDAVSLTLPEHGFTAIIGPNGAGKSTLLSAAARLVPLTGGSIEVDGLDVAHAPGAELARRLSILRQDRGVGTRLTVRELVAFGRFPHSRGRLGDADRAHIDAAIAHFGLGEQENRFLDELSGGQRQRAFVAMVMCQDTRYVLLDEPLNNLDMKHAVAMMKLLRRMADEFSKSIVAVLHDINFASCYADRIVAMKDGRIAFDGAPGELMRTATLRHVYDMEIPVRNYGGRRIGVFHLP